MGGSKFYVLADLIGNHHRTPQHQMVAPTAAVLQHLDSATKRSILDDAVTKLSDPNYVELATLVAEEALDTHRDDVLNFAVKTIANDDTDRFDSLCDLLIQFGLADAFVKNVDASIAALVLRLPRNWTPGFENLVTDFQSENTQNGDDNDHDQPTLTQYLRFLEHFMRSHAQVASDLDRQLLMLLGNNDENTVKLASNVLRWRMSELTVSFKDLWHIISSLLASIHPFHHTQGYLQWLRFINGRDLLAKDGFMEELLCSDQYWHNLYQGLASVSAEHRRYCVSILQISLHHITFVVDNDYMVWHPDRAANYENSWRRFITYYEIVALDTLLHQAEAASGDIIQLLAPGSLVKPRWGICLLSTGLRATTDNVRRFALDLLLQLPEELLAVLSELDAILKQTILPYALQASHFGIDKSLMTCPFGDLWQLFVARAVSVEPTLVLPLITYFAESHELYDPTRVFTIAGIVAGLKLNVIALAPHREALALLMRHQAETPMYDRALQTLNLKLLMKFQWSEDTESMLVTFGRWDIIALLADEIRPLLKNQSLTDPRLQVLVDTETPVSSSDLATVLASGIHTLKFDLDILQENLSNGLTDDSQLEQLAEVQFASYPQVVPNDLTKLWQSAVNCLALETYAGVEKGELLFRLFAHLYPHSSFKLDPELLIGLALIPHEDEVAKQVSDFYKLRNKIDGDYWQIFAASMNKVEVTPELSEKVLPALTSNSASGDANLAIVRIAYKILPYVSKQKVAQLLAEIWFDMVASRLQLTQRELHTTLIQTILLPPILEESIANSDLAETLKQVCFLIMAQCHGRRCIFPAMTRAFLDFEGVDRLEWAVDVLVKAQLVDQGTSFQFQLEYLLPRMIDQLTDNIDTNEWYQQIYGEEEISARVYLLALFNTKLSSQFANSIYQHIWENQREYNLVKVDRKTDANEERIRVQLYQILVSLIDLADFNPLEYFDYLLAQPLPWVRVYLEWIIAYHAVSDAATVDECFKRILDGSLSPVQITGVLRILFLAAQQMSTKEESQLYQRFVPLVITFASSNKALIRHFSLSLICLIYAEVNDKRLEVDELLRVVLKGLYDSVAQVHQLKTYRPGDAQLWDICNLTLTSISGEVMKRTSERDTYDWISSDHFHRLLLPSHKSRLRHAIGDEDQGLWIITKKPNVTKNVVTQNDTMLQTKSGAWSTFVDIESDKGSDVERSDLVVVASLVDKPPNLGGICRLSDVLGAGLMTVDDIRVKQHPLFKSVAVTADRWMPITEVKIDGIVEFLRQKKREGFTLIGLEQTDQSVQLSPALQFPKKLVFLLGKEREGIPGHLLAELDMCVEIKQVGVIRLMNIQTATAVLVHAYASQHC